MYHLGFDIGGTKCAVILAKIEEGSRPEILQREVFATADYPLPDLVLKEMLRKAGTMLHANRVENNQLGVAGVSCGGPLDSARGMVLSPPNLPGWDEVPVVDILSSALGLSVRMRNDANAGALAEWKWGASVGTDTSVFLTFGTGMGSGLIIGGRLYEGRDDLAGEVGHWRLAPQGPVGFGKEGSFEGFCSGGGMARMTREKILDLWRRNKTLDWCRDEAALDRINVRDLAEAARRGCPLAREVFAITGEKLGQGLSLLIDLLNPEVIVIGSIFTRCEDLLRPHLQEVVEKETLTAARRRCRIVPAELGEAIGDYATLAVACYS